MAILEILEADTLILSLDYFEVRNISTGEVFFSPYGGGAPFWESHTQILWYCDGMTLKRLSVGRSLFHMEGGQARDAKCMSFERIPIRCRPAVCARNAPLM